ncbi:hypothetical protein IFM89_021321 [Coptis chinensis]|uniref:Armadillo-like repeats domain-containing protein n=1 Tax=Coptis chinensis TaxID=261450 RepID=A0A835LSK7_9MAGN|nr:hypothetical protein IFM89_021321 [Coptis chinensis]
MMLPAELVKVNPSVENMKNPGKVKKTPDPVVIDILGYSEKGFKRKLAVHALFGKIFYLYEDAVTLRTHTLSEAGDVDSIQKMVGISDSEQSNALMLLLVLLAPLLTIQTTLPTLFEVVHLGMANQSVKAAFKKRFEIEELDIRYLVEQRAGVLAAAAAKSRKGDIISRREQREKTTLPTVFEVVHLGMANQSAKSRFRSGDLPQAVKFGYNHESKPKMLLEVGSSHIKSSTLTPSCDLDLRKSSIVTSDPEATSRTNQTLLYTVQLVI